MRIVKPNAKLLDHDKLDEYQFIEIAGRTCYKSENKITKDSAVKFVKMLAKNNHTAMLEHGTVYISCSTAFAYMLLSEMDVIKADMKADSKIKETLNHIHISTPTIDNNERKSFISASFRVFYDIMNSRQLSVITCLRSVLAFVCEKYPELFSLKIESKISQAKIEILSRNQFIKAVKDEYPEKEYQDAVFDECLTHTVVFTCDRGVSHEFVRHRPCSFAQESTRYCNYQKDKFGNEITVIKPIFYEEGSDSYVEWKSAMQMAENHYFDLLALGSTPQEARSVLPNSLKTELVITATEREWRHIIALRYIGITGSPHPQMKEVMAIAIKPLEITSEGRLKHIANSEEHNENP